MDGDQFRQIHGPESWMLGVSTVLEMFKGVDVGSESLNNLLKVTGDEQALSVTANQCLPELKFLYRWPV